MSAMQGAVNGLKRKACEMSGGSMGSAISRGSMDSGASADSKVPALLLHKLAVDYCPYLSMPPLHLCNQMGQDPMS